MGKWLKRIGLVLLAVLLIGGTWAYIELKAAGIIPRRDYETIAPEVPEINRPAVLLFDKTNGFIHRDAIPVANKVFAALAEAKGWGVFHTRNAAIFDEALLSRFDLIIWNNVSGDVLTAEQRAALRSWIEGGGGWLGVHGSGGDIHYDWDWYVNSLIGAQFIGHTMDPQFQDADLLPTDEAPELTSHLPRRWRISAEEWYAFDRNPRDTQSTILVTIDEQSYAPKGETHFGFIDTMDGEHPLVWRHQRGHGRVFYSALGHTPQTYQLTEYQQLLSNAMSWAAGLNDAERDQKTAASAAYGSVIDDEISTLSP